MNAPTGCPRQRGPQSIRGGFTLIEMMIVIVIILILMSLLVAAVGGAMTRARIAQVKMEISNFESGITNFKTSFGVEPPSSIWLYNTYAGWNSDARSQGLIRRMWPQFYFGDPLGAPDGDGGFTTTSGLNASAPPLPLTFPIRLTGRECLVFFLGGVRGDSGALTGFSTNPRQPFMRGGTRVGPFSTFQGGLDNPSLRWIGRLVDLDNNFFPEYVDPLPSQTMPYLYFSSYEGHGYASELLPPPAPFPPPIPNWRNTDCAGLMWLCYYESFDAASGPTSSRPHKANSVQIISPGMDNLYGDGGLFDPNNPPPSIDPDADNITNFHGGKLGD